MNQIVQQDAVLTALRAHEQDIIAIRRDIHAHPETAYEETRTAALVASKLEEWGIEATTGVGRTGVVGTIKGNRSGNRSIGLRADMDALFIQEKTSLPYSSQNSGKMHACGHDGHTAMLLGAARYLSENRDFAGTVQLIFQPAEEGAAGAKAMLDDGLLERFPFDCVYGMHNEPGMPVGSFGTRVGPMLAAGDAWTVSFHGTGGHGGAAPHLATDATIVQAHFVLAIQAIVGRNIPALDPAVISVGHIAGGSKDAKNIIPSEVVVAGTARSYSASVRDTIERRLRETAAGLAETYGCTANVDYFRGYPPLINHGEQTEIAVSVASRIVGSDNVNPAVRQITGAEDFAFMLEARPGAFILIGNGMALDGSFHNLHTPHYDFNDEILSLGSAYWVKLVQHELA